MLAPSNRLTLIDALRPPADCRFDSAMAVTFTLDLRTLLAAPAAFALAGSELGDEGGAEPIELLHAIRRHAADITVFAQAGQVGLPPSRRVFSFLEKSVVQVTAPRHGIVHPKVWVVRYLDSGDHARLRVLIASRNLAFDTSWDTILRLDQSRTTRGADLSEVATLFDVLVDHSVGTIDGLHRQRVEELCAALRAAVFAPPPGVDSLKLHLLGLDRRPAFFPEDATRSLVVSPFVTDDFFTKVMPGPATELVSRGEELDRLSPKVLSSIGSVFAFDDGSSPELDPGELSRPVNDPGRPVRGLHAKVFAFERGDRATVFTGSANATGVAFGESLELLAELEGPKSVLGIDALCAASHDEIGLRQFFLTYVPGDDLPDDDPVGPQLEGLRHRLGMLRVTGQIETDGDGYAVTYRSDRAVEIPGEANVVCWPLSSAGNQKAVRGGSPLEATFHVSLETISGFLAFRLSGDGHDLVSEFVVPVELTGVPEQRDRHLLKLLIGNAERFLRYLLALLAEDPSDVALLDAVEQVAEASEGQGDSAPSLPVLEAMLRTLRRDPAKLLAIDPVIRDLDADDALPEGFGDLWAALRAAAEARQGSGVTRV